MAAHRPPDRGEKLNRGKHDLGGAKLPHGEPPDQGPLPNGRDVEDAAADPLHRKTTLELSEGSEEPGSTGPTPHPSPSPRKPIKP